MKKSQFVPFFILNSSFFIPSNHGRRPVSDFLKQHYGPAEGPLGFPQTDKQARALEALLKALPREDAFRYRKRVLPLAPTELAPGERADVSWISTEDPDRQGDVVVAAGMD